jgi:hypothetical protein
MPKIGYSQHNNGATGSDCSRMNRLSDGPGFDIASVCFDGAARLGQAKKFVESRLLAMLRMLLAFASRWIIPSLELKPEFSKESRMANLKIKPSRGGHPHHGQQ